MSPALCLIGLWTLLSPNVKSLIYFNVTVLTNFSIHSATAAIETLEFLNRIKFSFIHSFIFQNNVIPTLGQYGKHN